MASIFLSSPPSFSSAHHNASTHLILHTPNSLNLRTMSHSLPIRAITLTWDYLKRLAANKAVEFVKRGMVLDPGTGIGSTATFVIAKLGTLLASGQLIDIVGVPTSKRTEDKVLSLGIPLFVLGLTIDDADEVDPNLNLIKGCGGALVCKKMVEAASNKFVTDKDDTKLVDGLGGSGLAMPVEGDSHENIPLKSLSRSKEYIMLQSQSHKHKKIKCEYDCPMYHRGGRLLSSTTNSSSSSSSSSSSGDALLSIAWLLDELLCCEAEFKALVLMGHDPSQIGKPPLDKILSELLDTVKNLQRLVENASQRRPGPPHQKHHHHHHH
ncbi:putative ribose-5-phosphate isomerase 3, chloroplastic [Glycine soja]